MAWSNSGKFHKSVFDPKLIVLQIVCLQCFFYLVMGSVLAVFHGNAVNLKHMFSDRYMSMSTATGWADMTATVVSGISGGMALGMLVERAKKCLDHTSTLFIFHLFLTWIYGGFPHQTEWWSCSILSLIIMVLLGEWLCVRQEMQEIQLG